MKTLFAALAGFALIGAVGATQVSAQRLRIDINRGNKHVQVDTTRSRDNDFRKPVRVEKPQPAAGHFITVKEKVWIPGHNEAREVRVFVRAETITVRKRHVDRCGRVFYTNECKVIPAHYETVCKQMYVPGCYEIREKRVWVADNCGCGSGQDNGHGHDTGHHQAPGHGNEGKKGGRNGRSRKGGHRR